MGYFLIAIGLVLVVIGVVAVSRPAEPKGGVLKADELELPKQAVPQSMPQVEVQTTIPEKVEKKSENKPVEKNQAEIPETKHDENKAKGDAFERFVVKRFTPKYFTLQEWRSDKYVDGVYAVSNHFPDLEVCFEYKTKGVRESFAIECKWRKNYYKNGIEWAQNYQIRNYKEYAEKLKIPVFVVIGVGGEPDKPQEVFIVPLSNLKDNVISQTELMKYRKEDAGGHFFWDYDRNELR